MIRNIVLLCSAALAAAEADADALYGAYGYAGHLGYGVSHLGYAGHLGYGVGHVAHAAPVHHVAHAAPVHHVTHAAPVHHVAPVHHAVGYGVSNVANTVGIHGVAPAAVPAVHGAYAGAGRYVANSAGTVHVAKREADAEPEADAAALYGAYGHHGLYGHGYGLGHRTYSLGYGHGIGHGYSALHHGYARYGYYGKRSAEAEPKADADALYGAYGHGLYGLGHRTYSLGYGLRHGYSALQPW